MITTFEKLGFELVRAGGHIAMARANANGSRTPLTLPGHRVIKGSTQAGTGLTPLGLLAAAGEPAGYDDAMHDTSAPTHGASEWSAIPPAMVQPPPRPVPRGGVSAIASTVSPAAAIGATALSMFSLFYGPVFLAMGAPRALAVAFAVPAVLGALLGAGWAITVWRGVSLLRRGESTLGEVVSVSEEGATLSSTLVRVSYTFRPAPGADFVQGSTVVPERPGLLEARAGDAMAVCFDPRRPKRSIALAALN